MNPIDILFDPSTGDLAVSGGDLVSGDSTLQHQFDIVSADKAHYHFDPALGVGIVNYLNDQTAMPGLTKSIRSELERDGQDVEAVTISPVGDVQIQANYPQ